MEKVPRARLTFMLDNMTTQKIPAFFYQNRLQLGSTGAYITQLVQVVDDLFSVKGSPRPPNKPDGGQAVNAPHPYAKETDVSPHDVLACQVFCIVLSGAEFPQQETDFCRNVKVRRSHMISGAYEEAPPDDVLQTQHQVRKLLLGRAVIRSPKLFDHGNIKRGVDLVSVV